MEIRNLYLVSVTVNTTTKSASDAKNSENPNILMPEAIGSGGTKHKLWKKHFAGCMMKIFEKGCAINICLLQNAIVFNTMKPIK